MEKDTAVIIVNVYAVLAWIGALFSVIGALAVMFVGSFFGSPGMMGYSGMGYGGWLAGLGILAGIVSLAVAILLIFVGIGLWKHQPWARIVTLVFSILGVLSIFSLNVIGFIIGGVGVWLFGFEPTVTGLFGAKPLDIGSKPAKAKGKKK